MGIEALVLGGLAIAAGVGGGVAISKATSGHKGGGSSSIPVAPQPLPQAPIPQASAEQAEESVRKRRSAATKTVFTDPLGVSGQADIVRKTLTGQ